MAKGSTTSFFCQVCGYESPRWLGRCPGCGAWNSLVEEPKTPRRGRQEPKGFGLREPEPPRLIAEVDSQDFARIPTGMGELDRVLGGGLVPGSYTLLAGAPGIGKSTLAMQLAREMARYGTVLYVTGEESTRQLKLRAKRLGALVPNLYVVAETDVSVIVEHAEKLKPMLLIIDSIQTLMDPEGLSAPGSVSQVRACAAALLHFSKQKGCTTLVLAHINKDGNIAGPRTLEHMVDTVLLFEGENQLRILRSTKNRFGPLDVGIFEHGDDGLREVPDPSALLLSERPEDATGSVVVPTMEGTRPLLVEVQALMLQTNFNNPRRTADGIELNRLMLLLAVLEKRVGLHLLNTHDAYVKITGGLTVREPAADLAIAVAIASSFRDRPADSRAVVIGEVGMAGEVRSVSRLEERIREAERRGFERAIIPKQELRGKTRIELIPVATVTDALLAALR